MSYPVQSLSPNSSPDDIKKAIARSIEQCMKEGAKSRDNCIAAVYRYAEKSTGRPTESLTTQGMEYGQFAGQGIAQQGTML
jgi:hypothetical protein